MFDELRPIVEPSSNHPSLGDLDLKPDVMILDEGGGISHWIECGPVSLNKLDKVARRLHSTRVIVLKASLREAHQLRKQLEDETRQSKRVEIWTWPDPMFRNWLNALHEKTELFGEARERSFNLVVNEIAYHTELISV